MLIHSNVIDKLDIDNFKNTFFGSIRWYATNRCFAIV